MYRAHRLSKHKIAESMGVIDKAGGKILPQSGVMEV